MFFLTMPVLAVEVPLPELKTQRVSSPYCGINSLYICLDSLGIETQFEDFISTRFVGTRNGSSAKELIEAAKHFGAHAEVFSNLTQAELYRIKQPMILHIRSTWENDGYNHWVAFFGFVGHHVRILDHPSPLQNMALAELLANWDGTAIVISKEPVETTFVYWSKFDLVLLFATLFCVFYYCNAIFKIRSTEEEVSGRRKYICLVSQSGGLVISAIVVGVIYHFLSPIGFLQNPTAVAEVTRRHYSAEIPSISLDELEIEMKETNPPLLLDVRREVDFQYGSIPKAVSLSVNSSLPERQQVLKETQKSQRILVFCQSQYCGYANEIAKFLKFNGYENIAIYRGGYREWSEVKKGKSDDVKGKSF
jgi:rhodanese-related sulfurtransferase